jgi:hypothetical protein
MLPIVHGLEDRYGDRINFVYLDIDNPDTAGLKAELNYRFQPQFVLVDGQGNIIESWTGPVSEPILEGVLQKALEEG